MTAVLDENKVITSRFDSVYKGFFDVLTDQRSPKTFVEDVKSKSDKFYKSNYKNEIYPDITSIEHEAAALYQIFKDTKGVDDERLKQSGLIEMLAFTNQLLLTHFESYHGTHLAEYLDHSKIKHYRNQIDEIRDYCGLERVHETEEQKYERERLTFRDRVEWVLKQTKEKFVYIWQLICHPGMLRDEIGWTNLTRIFWVFYHFSLNEMIKIVKDTSFIEKLGKMLGHAIDVDAIYKALNVPNDVLNVLSVAFFGVKLLIDVSIIAKHTFSNEGPEDEESKTSRWARFCAELDKRLPNIVNCFVWGGVNAVTNYPQLLEAMGIPTEFAMPIVAGVLTFDLSLSFWLWHRDSVAYDKSFKSLTAKINALKKANTLSDSEQEYLHVLETSLAAENEKWAVTNGTYQLNSLAAVTILTAFSTSLFLVNPALILACYLIGCLSISMYASAAPGGDYAKYLEASYRLDFAENQQDISVDDLQRLREQRAAAWSTFIGNLFERAFVPLSLIVLMSINPIIGLTTSIGYLTYKLYQSYNTAKENDELGKKSVNLHQFSLFNATNGDDNSDESNEQVIEESSEQVPSAETLVA